MISRIRPHSEFVQATVVIEASVAGTKKVLHEDIDFAFLDIDVTNGKTFEIAKILETKHVPFVFVRARRKNSCRSSCKARPLFRSLCTRRRLSACCGLSQANPSG